MTLPLGITRSLGPTKSVLSFDYTELHLCSNCHSYSLASLCPYTLHWIRVQLNLPYAHLRYLLEGYRPSQTNTVTRSPFPFFWDSRVSGSHLQGGISLLPFGLPPILHSKSKSHNITIQLRCMGSFRLPHN